MSKINKLGKSTFVIAILSFLLVAVLAFGGTYAYFTSETSKATGDFTTGTIQLTDIDGTAIFTAETDELVPGAKVAEAITVDADVNVKTMLVAVMEIVVPEASDITASSIVLASGNAISTGNWKEGMAEKTATADSKTTTTRAYVYDAGTNKFYIDAAAEDIAFTDALYLKKEITSGTAYANQGVNVKVSVQFFAVQYDYLSGYGVEGNYATATAAYTAACGAIASLPTAA